MPLGDVAGSAVAGRYRVPAQTLTDRDDHHPRATFRAVMVIAVGQNSQVTRHRPAPLQNTVTNSNEPLPDSVMTLLPAHSGG